MRRRLLVAGTLCALLLAPSGAGTPSTAKLFLGIAGDPSRFRSQTAQESAVRSFFIGWQQGQAWGKPFPRMLELMGPVPMFHVGTKGRNRVEAITPRGVANGSGDAFLVVLSQGVSGYGQLVYARFLAEGNHCARNYAAFTCAGGSRGPQYAPDAQADAFYRFAAILRGGTRGQVSGKLVRRGLPPYTGPDLPVNPRSLLRLIWNPLGGASPEIAANEWKRFYPGDTAVDVVGNDMYGSSAGWSSAQNEALYAFARRHNKPYGFPEWGLERDDAPEFVRYICLFIKDHAAIELAAYYEAKAGSPWDLGPRPRSRAEYRGCLTPLGKAPPS
jgi:hypothetical protein